MDDQLNVPLEDTELLAEVELTTNLIIAASESESTLDQGEVDRILGLDTPLIPEQKAREEKARALSVIVARWNDPAARLYARAGYAPRARETALPFPGCPHRGDWVLMVRPLALETRP